MKIEIMIAVLGIICIGALAAFFVAWAKADEQKKANVEERDRRWDEISLRSNVENELEQEKNLVRNLEIEADFYQTSTKAALILNDAMQDRLSDLLCPMNDHVWKDGRCAKCGRAKDD